MMRNSMAFLGGRSSAGVPLPSVPLQSIVLSPIKQAACRQGRRVWVGRMHGEIFRQMIKDGAAHITEEMQGFVAEDGEFLDRKAAYERAAGCGQIKGDDEIRRLQSHMLC